MSASPDSREAAEAPPASLPAMPGTAIGSTLICAGCGASSAPGDPYPFRCPNAARGDDTDHVLRRRLDGPVAFPTPAEVASEPNPYLAYRRLFHAYHLARAGGMDDAQYGDLVERLDRAVADVDGHGFTATPFLRSDALSDRLGFAADGGVWVKDETHNVSGSHKARHLFALLVHLEVTERLGQTDPSNRPHLAIASCGNAALAAAVVAAAGGRVLDVFVPVDADPVVVRRLDRSARRWSSARANPAFPVTRRTTGCAPHSRPVPCRSRARATRTAWPSRAPTRSVTRWPPPSRARPGSTGS